LIWSLPDNPRVKRPNPPRRPDAFLECETDMATLAFSLPVHERPEVLLDCVENIFRFNPASAIVLHASRIFEDFDPRLVAGVPGVYVNPTRFNTARGQGLMHCHCSNFEHLRSAGVQFDYFCLISSNEKFIRRGLIDYVQAVKNGFQAVAFDLDADWHVFARRVDQRPEVQNLLRSVGARTIYGGQTEGQFFETPLFAKICEAYWAAFGRNETVGFETEEVVPQTVAVAQGVKGSPPFTLVDYTHNLDFALTADVVAKLADPSLVGRVRLNIGRKSPNCLISPHWNLDNRSVFSVKRIPREVGHGLREFINRLPDRADEEVVRRRPCWPRRGVPLVPCLRWKQLKWHVKRVLRPYYHKLKSAVR